MPLFASYCIVKHFKAVSVQEGWFKNWNRWDVKKVMSISSYLHKGGECSGPGHEAEGDLLFFGLCNKIFQEKQSSEALRCLAQGLSYVEGVGGVGGTSSCGTLVSCTSSHWGRCLAVTLLPALQRKGLSGSQLAQHCAHIYTCWWCLTQPLKIWPIFYLKPAALWRERATLVEVQW